ncbi:hypothetical protein, partial [uncultured Rikenella sp.]|uniref:hypothetical protein n=1 Tax=uncultured Rikenella sp. TaxID=368003 RepID=UPI0026085F72
MFFIFFCSPYAGRLFVFALPFMLGDTYFFVAPEPAVLLGTRTGEFVLPNSPFGGGSGLAASRE